MKLDFAYSTYLDQIELYLTNTLRLLIWINGGDCIKHGGKLVHWRNATAELRIVCGTNTRRVDTAIQVAQNWLRSVGFVAVRC